jgi:acyl-CoA thioester hydrolase
MRAMTLSTRLSEAASRFAWQIRVYYEDTDAGGIVFYANYLKFFERARTEWLRACGVDQQTLDDETGAIFVVRSTALEYRAPARLDDLLRIDSTITRLGRASIEFEQAAWRGDTLLATGQIRVGCVERAALRPTPIPTGALEALMRGPAATGA